MDHIISTGADGRLDGITAAEVAASVQKALEGDCLVLHFHGGLVNKQAGEGVAKSLEPVYRDAGASPLFFVWQSGALEIVKHNLAEIVREELFDRLLRRVMSWTVGRLRDVEGGRAGEEVIQPRADELDRELAARKRDTDPSQGKEPFADVVPQRGVRLTQADEDRFVSDVEQDSGVRTALYGALADRQLEMTGAGGARGVPAVAPMPTRMDPAVLEEIAEGQVEGARGLASTLALARRALQVLRAVLGRYDLGTDHGVYPTVVEELLRAFYVADVGGAEWQAMKKETSDTFGPDGERGGRLVLDALAAGLAADGSKKITLVGHSTGAVFIDHLLAEVLRRDKTGENPLPAAQQFQVVFLAPAATTRHFADALGKEPDWPGRSRIGRFRMFTMDDEAEKADRLVGALYPRSLLYLVSGLLERDEQSKSAWTPLVGLSRYREAGIDDLLDSPAGKSARLADVRAYLEPDENVVLSPTATDAAPGFRSSAISHGDFDNNDLVRDSLAEMIRTWCQ